MRGSGGGWPASTAPPLRRNPKLIFVFFSFFDSTLFLPTSLFLHSKFTNSNHNGLDLQTNKWNKITSFSNSVWFVYGLERRGFVLCDFDSSRLCVSRPCCVRLWGFWMIGTALWFYMTDVFYCDCVLRFIFVLQVSVLWIFGRDELVLLLCKKNWFSVYIVRVWGYVIGFSCKVRRFDCCWVLKRFVIVMVWWCWKFVVSFERVVDRYFCFFCRFRLWNFRPPLCALCSAGLVSIWT